METGVISSVTGGFFVLLLGLFYSIFIGKKEERTWRLKICLIVSVVYLTSAFIVSQSFDSVNNFMMSDPSRYIETASGTRSMNFNISQILIDCYIQIDDRNELYNLLIAYWGAFCNTNLDGVSSYSLTLISVLFGLLSAITLFRILANYYPCSKAYRYTLAFALLSLFHFYSLVVIRDICICFFYLLCFEIVLKKFSVKGLVLLFVCMLIVWGIRLYSGLFVFTFILYYLYKSSSKSGAKFILIPSLLFVVAYIIISAVTVVDQSMEAIDEASEHTVERGGGLVMKLLTLPPGIRHIVMLFFTQIAPFPPTGALSLVESFSDFFMSIQVIVYEVWWYLIAYTMFYVLLIKKYISKIDFNDKLLLFIAVTLIIATSSHPDVRRMMPVYPIIYYEYLKLRTTTFSDGWYKKLRKNLAIVYTGLLFLYLFMKY